MEQGPDVVYVADAAADRKGHEAALGRDLDHIQENLPPLVAGGDVKKDHLVGALFIVNVGYLHRVAGIADVDELYSFDHATVSDIEARYDPLGEHRSRLRQGRQGLGDRDGTLVESLSHDDAFDPVGSQGLERAKILDRSDPA